MVISNREARVLKIKPIADKINVKIKQKNKVLKKQKRGEQYEL